MNRCATCNERVVITSSPGILRTWPSYDALVQSAADCDLCTLFRQSLDIWPSDEEGEITLRFNYNRLSVEVNRIGNWMGINIREDVSGVHDVLGYSGFDIYSQITKWLATCISLHEDCGSTMATDSNDLVTANPLSRLPRRLLDLSSGSTIVVIDVNAWLSMKLATLSELSEYCTLSYRWGDAAHDCLLSTSFAVKFSLPLSSMPQTFKDAIAVARALKIRFLWIDALCIVQPSVSDNSDWAVEGSRMGTIYHNSLFTIAATCASGADDGFLSQLGSRVYGAQPCKVVALANYDGPENRSSVALLEAPTPSKRTVYLDIPKPPFAVCVASSKLNKRGWVMQERALSKRVIHFTGQGLFWECSQLVTHDQAGETEFWGSIWDGVCHYKETLFHVARLRRALPLCPDAWFHLIAEYSKTNFTDPRDRMVALSSVARAVQPFLGGHEYCAGLWRNDLVRGLMWFHLVALPAPQETTEAVVPTWSWASVNRQVIFLSAVSKPCGETRIEPLVDVLDVHITPVLHNDPFGTIKQGALILRGVLAEMTIETPDREGGDAGFPTWDESHDINEQSRRCTILPIGAYRLDNHATFCALILEMDSSDSSLIADSKKTCRYRRIGFHEYTYSEDAAITVADAKSEWLAKGATTITIV